MDASFGAPRLADENMTIVKQRLDGAAREDGAKVTVDWRGETRHLRVISMPIDVLYFNPDTHRIRAQRTMNPARNRQLDEDPWTDAAQDYLRDLLRCKPSNPAETDPDFLTLMEELDKFGQKAPGIITPGGILVDGNTRCAALRELGVRDMTVGVLPDDTTRRDINDVELSLQLRRDKRRDYSYINRLIAIEDEIARGRRPEDVARDFNIKTKTLSGDRWVYQLIQDAIERSTSPDGATLRLVDFEEHQEKLRELYRDYTKLATTDPDGAERLKESRLAMVLLNFAKTTVRLVEDDFYERYVAKRLTGSLRPSVQQVSAVAIPGLPGVQVPDASIGVKEARALTDRLLKAKSAALAPDVDPTAAAVGDVLIAEAKDVFETAARMAGQNAMLKQRQLAVPDRVVDAADLIAQCVSEFVQARAKRALDEDALDDALLDLRKALRDLAKQAGRAFTSPGDGIAWLLDAARDER